MGFVGGYRYDIFVSYAHVDDRPLPGAGEGWVCTLVDALRTLLVQRLGRAEMLAVWRDLGLAGNAPLTTEILGAVSQSAALLVVLSEGYVASDWCRRELGGFLELAGEQNRRIFIVEKLPVAPARKPPEFSDRLGYRFWVREREDAVPQTLGEPVPTPTQPEYYRRLNRLASELSDELRRMNVP